MAGRAGQAHLLTLLIVATMLAAGCGPAEPSASPTAIDPAPSGSPSSPSNLSVADVYRLAEQTLRRPGALYQATIQVEADGGLVDYTGTTRQWVDAHRNVAREEAELGSWGKQTALLTEEGRYVRQPDNRFTVTGTRLWTCHGAGVAASAVLGCPGPTERSTTEVQHGQYAGHSAIVLVTSGAWSSSDATHTFTKRLYLDPDTYLPRALESEGQVDFGQVKPTRERRVYTHEFVAADALPADFFGPAAIGYVRPDPEEPLNQPSPDLTVYWLGRQFPGTGELPPLVLAKVQVPEASGGAGYRYLLDYPPVDDQFGPPVVTLQLWPRRAWDAVMNQGKGRPRWEHPCWQREDISLPEGWGTIFAGYVSTAAAVPAGPPPETGPCPDSPPDSFIGHAYLGQTVVFVGAPGASGPGGVVKSPYDTAEGMAAILRALRSR